MTREAAEALLGCQRDAARAEVRRQFQALHTDTHIRLTNAPTPTLRRTYQKALQDLRDACELLAPGEADRNIDLPANEPALAMNATPFTAPTARGQEAVAAPDVLPRSTLVAGVISAVLLTLVTAMGLGWWRERQARADLSATVQQAQQRLAAAESTISELNALFVDERMRVRNRSRGSIRILAAAVVYSSVKTGLHVAHSGSYGYPEWALKPDEVAQIDSGLGRGRDWDGRLLSYALLIQYADAEPFLKTGIWSLDVDRLDKTLPLELD